MSNKFFPTLAIVMLLAPPVVGSGVASSEEAKASFVELYPKGANAARNMTAEAPQAPSVRDGTSNTLIRTEPPEKAGGPEVIYLPVRRTAPGAAAEAAGPSGGEEPSEPSKARRFMLQQGIPGN